MSARIVEARARDALAIRALHRAVLEEGRWFVRTPDELPRLDQIEQSVSDYQRSENSVWLVARLDREPVVGFCTITGGALSRTRHVARLEVMVDRRHRGKGLGRQLVEAGVAWAEQCAMLRKLSLAVFDDNERAIGVYRSLGFVDEGHRKGEYLDAAHGERGDLLLARPV